VMRRSILSWPNARALGLVPRHQLFIDMCIHDLDFGTKAPAWI